MEQLLFLIGLMDSTLNNLSNWQALPNGNMLSE